jgi:ABC-2 type transport system permease protein
MKESAMRREGSALNGIGVVTLKELDDNLTSVRMRVLEVLIVLFAIVAVYLAIQQVRETTAEDPFLLLRLFTRAREGIPITFVAFLSILVPVMAIGLGFDAVNSEYNQRTLSRILAQPIYRDALLFGKFIAGLLTITFSLVALWLLVIGFGLYLLGVPPSLEETARAFIFLLVTIAYAGVWLALALLFSIVFRSPATAALVTFGLWLLLTFLWPSVLAQMLAAIIAPPDPGYTALGLPTPETTEWGQILSRLSPSTLFGEIAFVLLNPDDVSARSLGAIYLVQLQGAARGALPLGQSLIIAWPDMVGLVAGTIVLFTIGYMVFQRQEVRA